MADQSFRAMMERVYAQYGRDPDDSEGDEDYDHDDQDEQEAEAGGRSHPRGKRRAGAFVPAPPAAATTAPDSSGANWGQFLCEVLKKNAQDDAPPIVDVVKRDLQLHAREWATVDTKRVPLTEEQKAAMSRPIPTPVGTNQRAGSMPTTATAPASSSSSSTGIKSIYDDILEQYKDVVPPAQREMFRKAPGNVGPSVAGAEAPTYSEETETAPLDHVASSLTAILNRVEQPGVLLRALLRNEQRCLLTEKPTRTAMRASLIEFEKVVRPRLGSHAQLRRWRHELVGPWCGSEMRISASMPHRLLEQSMERWFGSVQRVHLDVYHPEDGLFVFCVYACASVALSNTVEATMEHRDPTNYPLFKGFLGDTRQYVFEGYLVTQSTESHERDLAEAEVYEN
jgi:hypothetical protein